MGIQAQPGDGFLRLEILRRFEDICFHKRTTVRRFLAFDAGSATAKGGPRGWDALTHLCFSKYLRLDPTRTDGFVRTATALLCHHHGVRSDAIANHRPKGLALGLRAMIRLMMTRGLLLLLSAI